MFITESQKKERFAYEQKIEALTQENLRLSQENTHLKNTLADALLRIEEIERRLGQNSKNSHFPPSRDLGRSPLPNHRKKGGPQGPPPGHPGYRLHSVEHPDTLIVHPLEICPDCHHPLEGEALGGYEKRQVFDLPQPVIQVAEHRAEQKWCACCRKMKKAAFPEGVNAHTQYGPHIQALTAYLHAYQMIPLARMADLLEAMTGHRPSEGTLLGFVSRMADQVDVYTDTIRAQLLESPALHADETGMRVQGQEHWIHVASTREWTLLSAHPSRGSQGMASGQVLPAYRGTVMHDFYGPYTRKDTFAFDHAYCTAHLSRECKGLSEKGKHKWARAMGSWLYHSAQAAQESRRDGASALSDTAIEKWERRYDRILELGQAEVEAEPAPQKQGGNQGRAPRTKGANLWERFRDHKKNISGYLRNAELPFDNNQAERDIRMVKVKQKISGCFRGEHTSGCFASLRGFISTLIKQNRPILASLQLAQVGRFQFTQGPE